MSLVIPEWSEIAAVSTTAQVIYSGPCVLKGIHGHSWNANTALSVLKLYDGISGTASNDLKLRFDDTVLGTNGNIKTYNQAFRTGLYYEISGSATDAYMLLFYAPLKGWPIP